MLQKRYCNGAVTVVIALLFFSHRAFAAVPQNDLCSGAELIPSVGPFPYLTAITDVREATTNGDPIASCAANSVSRTVWYQFTPPTTRLYTISCGTDTASTVQDSVMAIYTASSPCSGFTEVDCADDVADTKAAISVQLTANKLYYILVGISEPFLAFDPNTAIQVKVSQPSVPSNDTCAGAEFIPANGPFPYLTAVADTTLAASSGDPPLPFCQAQGVRSLWYRFTPGITAAYTLSVCADTATTVYDTLIGVYTSTGGCGGPYTLVACDDNGCGFRSSATTLLSSNTTYYIVVWEAGGEPFTPSETGVQIRVSQWLPSFVTTLPATSISSTGAVLNGSVNPNNVTTKAWFDWGVTTNYGNSTVVQILSSNSLNVSVSNSVAMSATPYHFRASASNDFAVTLGADQVVAWSSIPPQITSFNSSSNGPWDLQFNGVQGQVYLVESSSNLLNWISLGQSTDRGAGVFMFDDAATAGLNFRFYRIVAP